MINNCRSPLIGQTPEIRYATSVEENSYLGEQTPGNSSWWINADDASISLQRNTNKIYPSNVHHFHSLTKQMTRRSRTTARQSSTSQTGNLNHGFTSIL